MNFDYIKIKNKYGFSLFEVVVTMAIIAIFIAAASNVFTQKFKKKIALPAHGRFECYYDNSDILHQRLISEDVVVQDITNPTVDPSEADYVPPEETDENGNPVPVPAAYCTFEPVKAASYLVINAVSAGGAGGYSYGGSAGAYKSIFLTTTTHKLRIYPGKRTVYTSSNLKPRGDATFITDVDSDNREVMRLQGGRSNSGSSMSYSSCDVSYSEYTCRREPFCEIVEDESMIRVGYCKCDTDDVSCEQITTYTYSNLNTTYTGYEFYCTSGRIKFCTKIDPDKPAGYLGGKTVLYNLSLRVEGNSTSAQQDSDFSVYIQALDSTGGVADVINPKPGVGGARYGNGGPGAVVIAW